VFAALLTHSENAPLLLSGELGCGSCSLTPAVASSAARPRVVGCPQDRSFLTKPASGELGCSRCNPCSPPSVP
jgi:hypothetical protein